MKLSIHDRLTIGHLFPERGNLVEQIMVRDIVKKVEITSEEATAIKLRVDGELTRWDDDPAIVVDVHFSDAEFQFLREQAERLNKEGKITQENLSLCEKIMNTKSQGQEDKEDEKTIN